MNSLPSTMVIPSDAIIKEFQPLIEQGSLFCKVLGDSLMRLLANYEAGHIALETCEAEIGQLTANRIAIDLAGDSPEVRLAITEELDALRQLAFGLLNTAAVSGTLS